MLLMPIVLLTLGVPIFIILAATSAVVLFFNDIPGAIVHQNMFGGISIFSLLAVPFFIFAGELMGKGGMSKRLVAWALSILGGLRGSLPLTTVGTSTVFGAISGSSAATVAAVGRLVYPTLRQKGYNEKFATGVVTSSGAIAIVIPPSIAMILYGVSAEEDIAKLFIAGILPGLFMALVMGIYIYFYARVKGIRESEGFSFRKFAAATKDGIWALGSPFVILGGIYTGWFSPSESGGVACVYAILVTRYIYREIDWHGIWEVAISSAYLTAQVLIIVAAASIFSWLLTVSGVPQTVGSFITELKTEPWLVLLAINILLLIVGSVLDPNSAILVLTPLLVPIIKLMGIDPIHFGIIMTVNLAIGMFTPPFGLNIFVAQAVLKAPLKSIYPGLVPFIILNIFILMFVTYLPEMSLFLTR
jgi:C4-dicarboxylate transporter, DctM subunit